MWPPAVALQRDDGIDATRRGGPEYTPRRDATSEHERAPAAVSAAGSAGETWKSIVRTKRPSASAPPRPAAMPIAASASDSRCTIHRTDAGPGAERDAQADFAPVARHRIGEQAVQARAGEDQRRDAERGGQDGDQPLVERGLADTVRHGLARAPGRADRSSRTTWRAAAAASGRLAVADVREEVAAA